MKHNVHANARRLEENKNSISIRLRRIVTYHYSEYFLLDAIGNGFLNEKTVAKYICDQQPYCVH